MNSWVRLYHDTPSDPKWRTIAKKSGQRIGDVLAVWTFVLTNASANATERGRTENLDCEDVAAALDIEAEQVAAILSAMEGKVIEDGKLTGWEKRNPIKDDGAAERAKAWRERNRTQPNASERKRTLDKIREDKNKKERERGGVSPPSPEFGRFKSKYPSRGSASQPWKPAREQFEKHVQAGVEPEEIIVAAEIYAQNCDQQKITGTEKVAQALTWLRQERFRDYFAGIEAELSRRKKADEDMAAKGYVWKDNKWQKMEAA